VQCRAVMEDASNLLALPDFPRPTLHPTKGIMMALYLPPHTCRGRQHGSSEPKDQCVQDKPSDCGRPNLSVDGVGNYSK
jgi:hypothetical protein